ncbi:centrosome-associated protein 350-like [Hoplias malabaricus]|uniref:centrosome-associated protein 350-like n=1 Tax=Hoplias malabaricus TaxID=27720 RepID=UPI0034621F98
MPAMNRPGFLTKAGLRRLLTSDEVWSFGRKRTPGEQIQTEQENLQQTTGSKESCDSKRSLTYSHRNQPCLQVNNERKVTTEDGKQVSHQREPSKADSNPHGYEHETEKSFQSTLHKGHQHEKVTPPKSSEVYSGEIIQYPAEVAWKSIKNVQHYTSGQHNQTSGEITERAPILSSLSSDIEEDLPYDYEDSYQKPREQRETMLQEALKSVPASDDIECGRAITDNTTLNVENNQLSQTVLLLNNNHEICGESKKSELNTAYTQIWQNTKESSTDKPLITNLIQALSNDPKSCEESPSCDDSFSETEDKSEPFSIQSEALVWSEEERDVFNEEKTEPSSWSLVFAEKFIVVQEPSPYDQQTICKDVEVGSHDIPFHGKDINTECSLSEILSPVDEVLSYGSAELPPSVKGVGSGPNSNSLALPAPAFEIITWTSEEDLPAPQDFVEDVSINSENFPNLPADLSQSRKETRSLGSGSLLGNEVNDIAVIGDGNKTLPPGQEEEDEGSEYTSSLPVDENNEIEDPLSSFQIGDRLIVCNSRTGVLKYKGPTAFAKGFWAGVALDTPNGNHNGTFRGVRYFTCEKKHGVLVRAEDVTHLHRDHCSALNEHMDEDTFSDKDPPNGQNGRNDNQPPGNGRMTSKDSHSSSGLDLSAPKQTGQQDPCGNDATKETSNELSSGSQSSEKSPLQVDHELLCYNEENKHHVEDSDVLIERLTEEIFADALKSVQETRKRHKLIIGSKHDSKPIDPGYRKRENSCFTTNKPCLMDQWHQGHPETPSLVWVQPHEHSIVYRVVEATVEVLCGGADERVLEACETPSYLVDDKSQKAYRQVLYHLASDILYEDCANKMQRKETSVISTLQSSGQISVSCLKAAVKRKAQKVLNLERTDQQMTEMLQTLCKYWYAKRDRVDYILIQELNNEEGQWVDYSSDQITVKTRLAEEIFRLLLDDTISVLNHIYMKQK